MGLGTRKIAQQLGELEDQNSVPNTHIWWFTTACNFSFRRSHIFLKTDLEFKASTTVIPALGKQRQKDQKFKASMSYLNLYLVFSRKARQDVICITERQEQMLG